MNRNPNGLIRIGALTMLAMLVVSSLSSALGMARSPDDVLEGGQSSGGGKSPRSGVADTQPIPNPRIDMPAFLKIAREAAAYREQHRVTEEEFIRMSVEPGTIILDARSREKFDLLHVRGAINLSFPDIAVDTLARVLPDRNALILIYCNNNFVNDELAFPSKRPSASLNLSTYIALYSYGYQNVYELGPLLDVRTTKIPLEYSPPR